MKINISSFDLSNCRIQARLESKQTGKQITYSEVLERELDKAKKNQKSLINIVYFAPDEDETVVRNDESNVGKTIIVEHENNNICRYTLVSNSNEVNPDLNIISTRSNIGKALKLVKVDDVVEISGQLWHIIDIVEPSKTNQA